MSTIELQFHHMTGDGSYFHTCHLVFEHTVFDVIYMVVGGESYVE